jgi:biphenyl-2,3-diol 1,2-dioxygenase
MVPVSLAYIGLGVADVAAWKAFANGILHLDNAAEAHDGVCRLRFDNRAWRIALHEDPVNDIVYAGFETPDRASGEVLAAALRSEGAEVRPMTSVELRARNVQGGVVSRDPDGLRVEVVYGHENSGPYRSKSDDEFVTGELGLGHIVITSSDVDKTVRFYSGLGFSLSDYIYFEMPPAGTVRLVFLHCNDRHHTLALVPLPAPKRLNHLMLEVRSIDSVLTAYYRAQKAHIPIVRHLGRHTNDGMLSFYACTPAGFDVELGCEGKLIGRDWSTKEYNAISVWGHEP